MHCFGEYEQKDGSFPIGLKMENKLKGKHMERNSCNVLNVYDNLQMFSAVGLVPSRAWQS